MDVRGIGIDVIEVSRIERAVARWGEAFLARVFTEGERRPNDVGTPRAGRLAARFAAKEAAMKALGVGWRSMGWREIEIRNDPLGKPLIHLYGRARVAAGDRGVRALLVSLTHTHEYAAACVLAVGE